MKAENLNKKITFSSIYLVSVACIVLFGFLGLGYTQIREDIAFVRFQEAQLRIEPALEVKYVTYTLRFGDKVRIKEKTGDWLFVEDVVNRKKGWIHTVVITKDKSEINAISTSKKIPSALLYLDFKSGRVGNLAGTTQFKEVEEGWGRGVLPGQAIFIVDYPSWVNTSEIFGVKMKECKKGSIYYINDAGEGEPWPFTSK